MLIWRPIMDKLVTIGEVTRGEVDIIDLLKINALIDMRSAMEKRESDKAQAAPRSR